LFITKYKALDTKNSNKSLVIVFICIRVNERKKGEFMSGNLNVNSETDLRNRENRMTSVGTRVNGAGINLGCMSSEQGQVNSFNYGIMGSVFSDEKNNFGVSASSSFNPNSNLFSENFSSNYTRTLDDDTSLSIGASHYISPFGEQTGLNSSLSVGNTSVGVSGTDSENYSVFASKQIGENISASVETASRDGKFDGVFLGFKGTF